ncbi:hypothetical protein TRFO_03377 [Tritrichomonas foetus]|uniref:Uncharacterized protein n=1 Tax=Tritrichomonas foetus TaxID=1144522 RepID=A0A1J4KV31_9EUKA|nr:hypothetical protein TRFO_03377 [Tritrichomonas foetus]|eukprot:OHT13604.1 hypothetical protein TRFO_03377 [Tritrichomonas foetus]
MNTKYSTPEMIDLDASILYSEIVNDGNFPKMVTTSNPNFINFILLNINEILNHIINPKSCDVHSCQISKNLFMIFEKGSKELQNALLENNNLLLYLNNLIKSEKKFDIKSSISFSKIIQNLCYFSEGRILKNLTFVPNFIVNNMNNLAFKDLIIILIRKYSDNFPIKKSLIEQLIATSAKSSQLFFVITFLQELFHISNEFKDIFCLPAIVGALMAIASDEKISPLISNMFLKLVKEITDYKESTNNFSIIQSFEEFFEKVDSFNDCRIPVLLYLYKHRVNDLIGPFIEGKTPTFTNSAIISIIKQSNSENLKQIVDSQTFQKSFIKMLSKNKINGHLTKFAQILMDRTNVSPFLRSTSWNRFQTSILIPRIMKCTSRFGGEIDYSYSASPPLRANLLRILEEEKKKQFSGF